MKTTSTKGFLLPCTLLLVFVSLLCANKSYAQFHAGVDVKYSFGLCEDDFNFNRYDNTNSLGIALSGLYEFNPQIWAGVGVLTNINNRGMTIVDGASITQQPIMQFAPYLTFRYRSYKHLNLYLFTDLGYAIPFKTSTGIQTFSEGVMWNAGVGYSLMFAKHFGLNFTVGYNLQQIKGTPCGPPAPGSSYAYDIAGNNIRHSIAISVGVVF